MPVRIQRKRTKGWRMPGSAVYVGRPTVFGNPFEVYKTECGQWDVRDDNGVTYLVSHDASHLTCQPRWTKVYAAQKAVHLYRADLVAWGRLTGSELLAEAVRDLRGKDLACWCPLEDERGKRFPCHADVLLELANDGAA